jgi:alpha-beta hydrolase superfamily lysophospholipase
VDTSSFKTPDGLNIHTVHQAAVGNPKALVIVVHGISEHIGRYEHVIDFLSKAGYEVYGLDHRSHGKSDGKIRIHTDTHTRFVEDLKQFYDSIKAKHPDKKIFLLGHSMGSLISLQFVLAYPKTLAGLVVTGTATDVGSSVSSVLRNLGNFINRFAPQTPLSPPLGVEGLTNDPDMQAKWRADTLTYKGATRISMGKFIIETGEKIQARAKEITLPIMFMHGESDILTPISGSHIMYERVGSSDKTIHTYPNMQHEIMNEVERNKVLQTIVDWFDKHL